MKIMHWTNTSMHLHNENLKSSPVHFKWQTMHLHQDHCHQKPLVNFPAPPTTLIWNADTFSYKRHRVQRMFYGALQQLHMLLHVQWRKQNEGLSH